MIKPLYRVNYDEVFFYARKHSSRQSLARRPGSAWECAAGRDEHSGLNFSVVAAPKESGGSQDEVQFTHLIDSPAGSGCEPMSAAQRCHRCFFFFLFSALLSHRNSFVCSLTAPLCKLKLNFGSILLLLFMFCG